uniref:SPRY domain-containing protein n=1 Tax=Zooxanthella nutricula TaxID=1333877 RepID=A0A6U6ULS0_9DINO|mmetsp:Transcript_85087/g.259970  ORF Transcript_85087/g.259970 Transcript_85087/m.259970 type:complete len:229 (+) Transcript_85087:217-903(+)
MGAILSRCKAWLLGDKTEEDAQGPVIVRIRERGPGIRVFEGLDGDTLSGTGSALAEMEVEQDAAYWEVHILALPAGARCCMGVARQNIPLDAPLVSERAAPPGNSSDMDVFSLEPTAVGAPAEPDGFEQGDGGVEGQLAWALSSTGGALQEGDVVGVAFGQASLPNLRFMRNGEHTGAGTVTRVRGSVHPAFSVSGGASLSVVFDPDGFRHQVPRGFAELRPSTSLLD